ncbi:MAG: alkaline phosphatase family protein [Candidatus Hydrogenedentes bacterium]|nr:alkaline phosphatase family protein [Candidatus Hydrogenedentota bacterium]
MSRVLLIGLDGADPALLSQWMDAGLLPHLAALRTRGTFCPLTTTRPPVTFPAWTTCVTGVNPGKHGIFDFTRQQRGAHAIRFINSTYRRVPALWNILSSAGKRVCVVGVPATYPPEPVNGVLVAGFDSPVTTRIDASFVYPESAWAQVKDWRFADFQEGNIGAGWHDHAHRKLLEGIATKEAILLRLMDQEPWDFFMAVFGEVDTASHHFWLFHDEASPRHRPGPKDALREVYVRLDTAVGRLVARGGEDTHVLVVSDHGFQGAGTGVVHLNNWLAELGWLQFTPAPRNTLKSLALRLVPPALRGALFRRFAPLVNRVESQSRFGGIDWSRTRAWSEELNYFPAIRLNLAGRDPAGVVPQNDYDATVEALCAALMQWEHIAHAWPRAALFDGPEVEHAPDIVLELATENGYAHSCLRSRGGPAFRRLAPGEYFGGKEKGTSGVHRDPGILLSSMPVNAEIPHIADIAPTVLHLLGVPGPPMDGASLTGGALSPGAVAARPAPAPYTPEEEAVLEERLRALGYLE